MSTETVRINTETLCVGRDDSPCERDRCDWTCRQRLNEMTIILADGHKRRYVCECGVIFRIEECAECRDHRARADAEDARIERAEDEEVGA